MARPVARLGAELTAMATVIAVAAIIVSVLLVAFQVWRTSRQAEASRRAEFTAAAFFEIYEAWADNRRAQVVPVDDQLLRTSSARFYAAAFKLSALLEPANVDRLGDFMKLAFEDEHNAAFRALVDLHGIVAKGLGYVREPVSEEKLTDMFWPSQRNVPTLFVGHITPTRLKDELPSPRTAAP
jgi:hypothetical protein